jgi:Peptidase M15
MQLTDHFTREEFEKHGPMPDDCVGAYKQLAVWCLEPVRLAFGEPMVITSGYRSPEHNAEEHGVSKSQHIATPVQAAADYYIDSYHSAMQPIFDWCRMHGAMLFDQLILEHDESGDVIHVSWVSTQPRRMALEGATHNSSPYVARYVAPIQGGTAT